MCLVLLDCTCWNGLRKHNTDVKIEMLKTQASDTSPIHNSCNHTIPDGNCKHGQQERHPITSDESVSVNDKYTLACFFSLTVLTLHFSDHLTVRFFLFKDPELFTANGKGHFTIGSSLAATSPLGAFSLSCGTFPAISSHPTLCSE